MKTIKVSDTTHTRLIGLMAGQETFDDIVTHLINFYLRATGARRKAGLHGQALEESRTPSSPTSGGQA